MVQEIETQSGVLGISTGSADAENSAQIVKIEYYRGKDISVRVPENILSGKVCEIGKKAFLGAKTLTMIEIPDTVESIGDWAFASCSALKEIILPGKSLTLGNGLFKDCSSLERIVVGGGKTSSTDISYLLALSVSKMDAPYLLDIEKAGSEDWISHFDSVITQILARDDADGFSKMLLCGEEDYVGDDSNYDTYCLLKRKEKVRIILTRLLHSFGIDESARRLFSDYLVKNMTEAVWPLVLEEHGEQKEYFDLLIETGCINENNISKLIDDMGERNTQMKGYLIRYKGENADGGDFLDDLEL